MSRQNAHYGHELQDLLDNRLPDALRAQVAEHVASCAQCRAQLETLASARNAVRGMPNEDTPRDLQARVLARLDAEDAARPHPRRVARPWRARRVASYAMLAAAAVLLLFVARRPPAAVSPAQIAEDFAVYAGGRLDLEVRSAVPAEVEAFFRRRGLTFATRVFDLGMMGYTVAGGAVRGTSGHARALYAYRGADGTDVVCQMYVARVSALPPPSEVREHDGITFAVYREGDLTMVFWQEGPVICVLASDARPESVVELAFAKAIKV